MDHAIQQMLCEPICDQYPAGKSVRYEEPYRIIEQEITKLSYLGEQNQTIDYAVIIKESIHILTTQSKDILISLYLSYALLKHYGIDAFIQNLDSINAILKRYWETGYPLLKRPKSRINAFNWWYDHIMTSFKHDTLRITQEQQTQLLNAFSNLDTFFQTHFEIYTQRFYPSVKPILEKSIQQHNRETKSDLQHDTVTPTPSDNNQTIDPKQTMTEKITTLHNDLTTLFIQDTYNEYYFILNRVRCWQTLPSLDNINNSTDLNAPSLKQRQTVGKLYKEKAWKPLLQTAEDLVPTYPLWLDLHYFVSLALKELNQPSCAQWVEGLLTHFIHTRGHTLLDTQFNDTTSLASSQTRQWIKSLSQPSSDDTAHHQWNILDYINLQKPPIGALL